VPGVAIRVQNRKLPGLSASAHSNLQWPVLVWENGICGPITSSDCFSLGLGGRDCPLGRLSRLAEVSAALRMAFAWRTGFFGGRFMRCARPMIMLLVKTIPHCEDMAAAMAEADRLGQLIVKNSTRSAVHGESTGWRLGAACDLSSGVAIFAHRFLTEAALRVEKALAISSYVSPLDLNSRSLVSSPAEKCSMMTLPFFKKHESPATEAAVSHVELF
jgi:hypothetical protein